MRIAKSIVGLVFNVELVLVVLVVALGWGSVPFGITPYTILSGSMEPRISIGSLVYVDTQVEGGEIAPDEIIAFNIDEARNKICTHRVVSNDIDSQSIRTKGDANAAMDAAPVAYDRVVGRVVWSIPYLGSLLSYISENRVIAFAIIILMLLSTGILHRALSHFKIKTKPNEEAFNGTADSYAAGGFPQGQDQGCRGWVYSGSHPYGGRCSGISDRNGFYYQ